MRRSSKFIYVCFTIAPLIIAFLLKRRKKEITWRSSSDQDKIYYRNIFLFNRKSCRDHVIKSNPCSTNCPLCDLTLMTDFIGSAKQSISICVLTLQLLNIFQALLKAHQKGVKVRIILDKEMISADSRKLQKLKEIGIPVKTQVEISCLHHKFCIVDEDEKSLSRMVFGSMNFTMQGILCNYEHITMTNNYEMIRRFVDEFNNLWNEFRLLE